MIKKSILILTIFMISLIVYGCAKQDEYNRALSLYLNFDEGEGTTLVDQSRNLPDSTLQYVFTNPEFQAESQDPQWRPGGIKGGSLLFDGYSNFSRYNYDDIALQGDQISIEVWVAPRYFESNSGQYTSIISQYNSDFYQGLFLGYSDYGHLYFTVGIGDRMLSITDNGTPLISYEWNYVVAVFDGTNGEMALYLNGELVAEQKFFENSKIEKALDEPLYIAKNSEGKSNATASLNMFSGLMDELKIYTIALPATYVKNQFETISVPTIDFSSIWMQNILQDDFYKTQYHGGPYQHWMNEPHAPIYYQGVYHLFFQFNMMGPYFANISWGHLVSDDMVNWTPLKEVIIPEEFSVAKDGVWSGASTYDADGVPVLLFTAGNYDNGLISSQNVGIARPKDPSDPYLKEWVVDNTLGIAQQPGQGTPGEFPDASVIYEDGVWYLTICSASTTTDGGTALLYQTTDDSFHNWTYVGQFYEIPNQRGDLGYTWELPVLLPVWNENKTIKKYVLLISPAPADRADNDIYYFVGQFDKVNGRFIPDPLFENNPHLLDYGNNVFTGPSGFVDPVSGKSYVFSIMQDQRKPSDVAKAGWANSVGLAREIYLLPDGSDVGIRPVEALNHYTDLIYEGTNLTLDEANNAISNIEGDMLHIQIEFDQIAADALGINVRKNSIYLEETTIYYDTVYQTVGIKTGLSGALNNYQNITGNFGGKLILVDGKLMLDIYLDRSLVEVFANEYKAISSRIYPDPTSLGLELFSENGTVYISYLLIETVHSIYD